MPGGLSRRAGPVEDFNPIADLPTGVQLSFFGSFVLGTEHFPVADVPVTELVAKAEGGVYRARPARSSASTRWPRRTGSSQLEGKAVVVVR